MPTVLVRAHACELARLLKRGTMSGPHINPLSRSLRDRAKATPTRSVQLPGSSTRPSASAPDERTWSANTDLYSYITERGFFFPQEIVSRYLMSLQTSPFVLFSGISGTGKTKLALLTAEYFAWSPGTTAARRERPTDDANKFYIPVDKVTMRSGTITPRRDQYDYFEVQPDDSAIITCTITNILGAHGDISLRAHNSLVGNRRQITIGVPVNVRRALVETGVTTNDYLCFEVVEEFKRFKVSLFRPREEFVEELPENRYAFISVRPSWSDHTALLGHYDEELERYMRTPLLELLLRAHREEAAALEQGRTPAPYFVILDEMNIAKIEHYFSDFLSALESRRYDKDGNIQQEPLLLHDTDERQVTWLDEQGIEYEIPRRLKIPTNVLFTGTVNDDASTYELSPKVLDRANTMVFNTVDFDAFLGVGSDDFADSPFVVPPSRTMRLQLGAFELSSQKETQRQRDDLMSLMSINDVLAPLNLHFGYRVLNDIAMFVRNSRDHIGDDPEMIRAAVDVQILQKVLPKLFTMKDDRNGVMATLLELCLTGDMPDSVPLRPTLLAATDVDATDRAQWSPSLLRADVDAENATDVLAVEDVEDWTVARFPRAAGRLYRMLVLIDQA